MLLEESIWIGDKLKTIINEKAFPILNVGSSTLHYRTKLQPYVQENIFDKIPNEEQNVIHQDMKQDVGVDLVGDLYDDNFVEKLKELKPKTILCNNILMYLEKDLREKMANLFYEILPDNGYLIVSNSHTFFSVPDPVEAFYRDDYKKMYRELFNRFQFIDGEIIKTMNFYFRYILRHPRYALLLILSFLKEPKNTPEKVFMKDYLLKKTFKRYSASCLFLQKVK